jgi:O-antigen/teichoic acid export membrane protein
VVLAALANPISRAYGEPEVAQLLYVVAASIPLTSVWVVTSARLILEFQFGRYAMVSLAATAVQYGGIVLFALLGYGALSFVIPLPLVAVTSSLGGWLATRQRLWRRPTVRTWGRMIDSGRWLVAAALAAALFTQGDYLAIGAIVSSTTLGIYYFAFQIPAQLGVFASTLSGVLLSALSRLGTVEEQGKALARTLRALMLLLCGTSMLIATIYPALEKIVWGTKWESSITPVIVLALLMPFRLLYVIGKTAYLTAARFRTWSLIVTAEAVGLVTTAALTAAVNPTPTGLALGVGLYLSVSVLWIVMRGVRAYGISSPHLIRLILPVWLYSISAFLAAAAPMQFADLPDGSVLVLALQASTYVVVAALLFRTFAADALRDCLAILPAAARRRALKWLRLTLPTESPTFPL